MAIYRSASKQPPVDQMSAALLVDPAPASVSLLGLADQMLHSLTTEWGYPPFIQRMHMTTSVADRLVPTLVPPMTNYFQVGLLVSGRGSCVITAPTTSDTTKLSWYADDIVGELNEAIWVWTSREIDDTASSGTSPPLKMKTSPVWTTEHQVMSLNPAPVGANGGTIWAVATAPIWLDATV